MAIRDSQIVSHALEGVLDEMAASLPMRASFRPVRKQRLHVSIARRRLVFIDLLAAKWGIKRSQVVMRLIDLARSRAGTA